MCCCCPQAIQALFCLWFKSGCSKDTVAGALTFFPPDPPYYRFARISKEGAELPENDGEDNANLDDGSIDELIREDAIEHTLELSERNNDNNYNPGTSGKRPTPEQQQPQNETENREEDPVKMLTDRALELRRIAHIRNQKDAQDANQQITYRFLPDPRLPPSPSAPGTLEAVKIGPHPKTHSFVAALIFRLNPDLVTGMTKTIIYSHGNATDVGAMNYIQMALAKGLLCNVVIYDYSGYGASGGVPLEANTYRDIEQVYQYVVDHVESKERNIVVYGQSVGSGPSCYICSKKQDVGGLVLHSPFMSGMRVITPSRALACLDIFPNIDRIKKVKCPVMVIHGALDEEVRISHGKALHHAVPKELQRTPWWVPDRGHNDITDGRTKMLEYIDRMRNFLESLDV